jgi:hypothetical protein
MHEIANEDPGRHAEQRRGAFGTGFHQRFRRIWGPSVHKLILTHALPSKNKKFPERLILTCAKHSP